MAPEPLTIETQHEFHEHGGKFGIRRSAKHSNGIGAHGTPSLRRQINDPAFSVGLLKFLDKRLAIEIDRHAGGGFSTAHIHGRTRRGIREIPGIGGDLLNDLQAEHPAFADRLLLRFNRYGGGWIGAERGLLEAGQRLLHLLLDDHFKGHGRRSTFAGISQGDVARVAGIGQIRPLTRRVIDAEPLE